MLLEARNLTKSYRRGGLFARSNGVKALDRVSFSLGSGGSLGVVGESGSGKSTLLRVILRLVSHDDGTLIFDGSDTARLSGAALRRYRRRVQPVFQDPYSTFNPRFSIGSSIALGLAPSRDRRGEVERLLVDVGLDPDLADALPHELSGGQRQRAAIARALAVQPDLLLLDEPTSALDVSVQAQVLNLLKDLRSTHGFSIILVTHDLPVVTFLCEDLLVMRDGAIVERGPTLQIIDCPSTEYARTLIAAAPEPPLPTGNIL